jgi:lysozyme
MTNTATALTLTAAGLLLIGGTATARGHVEAGEGGAVFDLGALADTLETTYHQTTQALDMSNTNTATAARNVSAFLAMIRRAEGTDAGGRDPYRVCYGYRHTIGNMSEHPAITGEWRGERLSDAMCANAGFGPGCVSTAAGAYQIIRPTWARLRDRLRLPDFGRQSQDLAAVELVRSRGAMADVQAGRFADAVHKCRQEWASLPGNYAKQGQRSLSQLLAWYTNEGGTTA